MRKTILINAINAATATATSNKIYVGGATRIALLFRRAAHASGNTVFSIKAGLEEAGTTVPTMTALNLWIDNVTNANTEQLTRVNAKTLSGNLDAMLFLDPACLVNWLEITATRTTDGTNSVWILCEY